MTELLIDHPAPGITRLLINRPEARNAINAAVRQALYAALIAARDDPAIRAVIIGGAGGFFSAGGDLPSMVGIAPEAALARMQDGHRIVALLWTFPKPVIAAVERAAVGAAAGIAMLADRIVIGKTATLLFPFLRLGLVPDWDHLPPRRPRRRPEFLPERQTHRRRNRDREQHGGPHRRR